MSEVKVNAPKIRFPGFTNAWEQHKLGGLYTERKERGHDSLPILSVSIHHGVSNEELDSETLGKNVRRSEDKSLYKHVYFGDLVFNMMRAWQGAIGVVKSEGMVSPAYITAIPSEQLYPLFMDYCLRRDETSIQIDNLSYGVTDFRKRLYWDSFINVLCRIPSVAEQERITAFFTHLDNLITLHQRKLNNVKNLKAGLLQKMFPKDGEDIPEVRFPGFTDAWEQRKVGEVIEDYLERSTKQNQYPVMTSSQQKGIIFQEEYFADRQVTTNDNIGYFVLPKGYFTYRSRSDTDVFVFNRNDRIDKGIISYFYPVFRAKNIDSNFLLRRLNNGMRLQIARVAEGTGQRVLSLNKFKGLTIKIPTRNEQEKIGLMFESLDHLINLHQRKLEHLQQQKKSLLQQMFV
jgi:Restriction endonuclease S subunits